jgi:hypothetical protein
MNKFFSLLALAFSFTAFSANAAVDANTTNDFSIQMELNDNVAEGAITMTAAVLLPDGTTSRKSKTFRNMQQAVDGYVKFVTTLPYGSTLIRVQFTDEFGNVVFAAQG